MEVYKRETKRLVARFLRGKISFPQCISSLDATLAQFILRMCQKDLDDLRKVMLANNEKMMKEMERRSASGPS